MSGQFWSRKLEGAYVYHEGKYKCITGLKLVNEEPLDDRYPEDTLPFVRFRLDDEKEWHSREDFDIRFPEEGYARVDDKAVFAGRTMVRAWKIAPSRDNYKTHPKLDDLSQWLNADPVEFDPPEKLFDFKADAIFTPKLAAKTITNYTRKLFYCGQEIATVNRTPEKIGLSSKSSYKRVKAIARPWKDKWGMKWDYAWPEDEPLPGKDESDFDNIMSHKYPQANEYVPLDNHIWRFRPVKLVSNYDYTHHIDAPGFGHCIKIMINGAVYGIPDMREAVNCFGYPEDAALLRDIFILLKIYSIIPIDAIFEEECGLV